MSTKYKVGDIVSYKKELAIVTNTLPSLRGIFFIDLITADGKCHSIDSTELQHALEAINLDDNWNFTLFELFGRYITGLHETYSQRFNALELDVVALQQNTNTNPYDEDY